MQENEIIGRLDLIQAAALRLASVPSELKNQVLIRAADALRARAPEILIANGLDVSSAGERASAFIDRLTLSSERIELMAESLLAVAQLPDPVGETVEARTLENGLRVSRVRAPLGVIFMIFEARPNVAIEAFSLGFKAGNAMILRGGSESVNTTRVLYSILSDCLRDFGTHLPFWGISDPNRALVDSLLGKNTYIDVVVPRGGEKLIDHVTRSTKIPVIKNDRGMCHVYVHEDADLELAAQIVNNAKTQRPGVCNAMETLLVHEPVAARFLPSLYDLMDRVQWYACPASEEILRGKTRVSKASPSAWDTEYLDLKINCRVVHSIEQAIEHIRLHGSRHSEAIVTKSESLARFFQKNIDAAAVYWNASTRFTDGFTLGLGGELGISTQKLHVRGPVGLKELTSVRWVIDGPSHPHGDVLASIRKK